MIPLCQCRIWDGVTWKQLYINTLRPRQNGRLFADDTFKHIFLNENVRISIKISLNFVSKGPIDNNPALVQIMAWRRPGDKPLSEPMVVSLPTHICVTRPQWVNNMTTIEPCKTILSAYLITYNSLAQTYQMATKFVRYLIAFHRHNLPILNLWTKYAPF